MEDPSDWDYQEREPVHGSMASAYITAALVIVTIIYGITTYVYVNYF